KDRGDGSRTLSKIRSHTPSFGYNLASTNQNEERLEHITRRDLTLLDQSPPIPEIQGPRHERQALSRTHPDSRHPRLLPRLLPRPLLGLVEELQHLPHAPERGHDPVVVHGLDRDLGALVLGPDEVCGYGGEQDLPGVEAKDRQGLHGDHHQGLPRHHQAHHHGDRHRRGRLDQERDPVRHQGLHHGRLVAEAGAERAAGVVVLVEPGRLECQDLLQHPDPDPPRQVLSHACEVVVLEEVQGEGGDRERAEDQGIGPDPDPHLLVGRGEEGRNHASDGQRVRRLYGPESDGGEAAHEAVSPLGRVERYESGERGLSPPPVGFGGTRRGGLIDGRIWRFGEDQRARSRLAEAASAAAAASRDGGEPWFGFLVVVVEGAELSLHFGEFRVVAVMAVDEVVVGPDFDHAASAYDGDQICVSDR
ncbi:LOW QUALITY PROTEIN: hypothetical protein PanWU01x14_261070, partial [Parasponia andersonii]